MWSIPLGEDPSTAFSKTARTGFVSGLGRASSEGLSVERPALLWVWGVNL